MKTWIENYLFSTEVNIDNNVLAQDLTAIEQTLKKTIKDPAPDGEYGCFTSANHLQYNLFDFHTVQLNRLFKAIQQNVVTKMPEGCYVIQCWFNMFRYNQFIDWHGHWPSEYGVYHGYYCVDVEPSTTAYRLENGIQVDIPNKNGLLVFGLSGLDQHKSSKWTDENRPRITVAFDIIPVNQISEDPRGVHYNPI